MGEKRITSLLERLKPLPIYIAGVLTPAAFSRTVDYLKKIYETYTERRDKKTAESIADAVIKKYKEEIQSNQ